MTAVGLYYIYVEMIYINGKEVLNQFYLKNGDLKSMKCRHTMTELFILNFIIIADKF